MMNISHRAIQLPELPSNARAPHTLNSGNKGRPAAAKSGNLSQVFSRGITGHATSHAPILVGPILRVEKERPEFPHYITL